MDLTTPPRAAGDALPADSEATAGPAAGTVLARVEGLRVEIATTGLLVLDDVDLVAHEGQHLGLVGPSGCGKTTLALALLGHVRPGLRVTAGRVRVGDVDMLGAARGARRTVRRRVLGWLGQDPATALTPTLRVGALLRELRSPGAVDPGGADEALLATVGLDETVLRRYPHELSGGQLRRVALVRALAARPRLLILDEPTAGLDHATRQAVLDTLERVTRRTATTLLVISHDRVVVRQLCGAVVTLDAGRVVAAAPTPNGAGPAATRRPPVPGWAPKPAASPALARSSPVLQLAGLHAGYGRGRQRVVTARNLNLSLTAGECVALTGPSGSGKSTLARCLVGLHRPDAGSLLLDDVRLPATAVARTAAQRRAVQLVPQDHASTLHPLRSVGRTLEQAVRRADSAPSPTVAPEVGELLRRVRLEPDLAHRRPGQLSGGQRQRVAIARALAVRPRVLICDEITSALDPDVAATTVDLLLRLCTDLGLAVLLITHDLELAWSLHRVVHLDRSGALTPASG